MGEKQHTSKRDCVRVVPLATPELAKTIAAPQSAQLVYNNGPLIASVQVFAIFWGTAWQQAALAAIIPDVNKFFDYILTSPAHRPIEGIQRSPVFNPTRETHWQRGADNAWCTQHGGRFGDPENDPAADFGWEVSACEL